MAGTLQQQLDSIRAKATVLVERYNKLAQAHRQALSSVVELEGRLAESEARRAELENEIGMLRSSAVIAPTGGDIHQARRFLSELLREIDKCISDLTV